MRNKTVYQMANRSDAEVIEQFIVRKNEFDLVMSDIRRDDMTGSIQHYIFVGQRGSGKSTLLRRIEAEIKTQPNLSDHLIAVNLSEEQAGIYRLNDLWYKVNEALRLKGIEIENVDWKKYGKDATGYARDLYTAMQKALKKEGKKLVILLDNIDRILKHIKGDDNHLFRELLMNHKDVRIVGGSTRLSEHYWKYDQPFYQFFRVIRLEPVTQAELKELLFFWASFFGKPELNEFIDKYPGKLNAVRILSDGMPRTMLNLVELLINKPDEHGYEYLLEIIDNATPIYQERLGTLSDLQQKVLLELSFHWDATDLNHLDETARMDSKLLSAVLKQLVDLKLIEKKKGKGKNYYYLLIERFFNLWLIMTQGGPQEKCKVKWLTAFLETWYNADELKDAYRLFAKNLSDGSLDADHAVIRAKAFVHSKMLNTDERDELIESIERIALNNKEYLDLLPAKARDIYKKVDNFLENDNYDGAIIALEAIEQDDRTKDFLLGLAFHYKGEVQRAEKFYLKAIEKGDVNSLFNLANLYYDKGKFKEAEKFFLLSAENGNVEALYNLAVLYYEKSKADEAEKYYLKASAKGHVNALYNLANLYLDKGQDNEAEKYFLQAIDKGHISALYNLANLYMDKGQSNEAEKYYLQAIDKGHVSSLYNLAIFYKKLGKTDDAEKYYLLASEAGHVKAMFNLAIIYKAAGKIDEAEKYYLKAIEKDHVGAMYNLAIIYSEKGLIDLAEKYYLLATEKGHSGAPNNLANLYRENKRIEEAEKYYLLAIERGNIMALYNIGILCDKMNRIVDAKKYYLAAIEKGHVGALNNLSAIFYRENKDPLSAVKYLASLKALKKPTLKELFFDKVVSLWAGNPEVLDNCDILIIQAISEKKTDQLELFIKDILIHQQRNIVWDWFQNKDFGEDLRDMLKPLYFATARLLNTSEAKEVLLTQPPELNETVEEVYQHILNRQEFYYGKKK